MNRARSAAMVAATASLLLLAGCSSAQTDDGAVSRYTPSPSSTSPTGSPSSTPSSGAQGTSPLGAHWDPSRTELWTDYLKTIPGSQTYYELTWCKLSDSPVQVRWKPVDKAVTYANSLNITTMLKIRVGTCWVTEKEASKERGRGNKTESHLPKDMAQYSAFVAQVVQRYSAMGVHEYAIENEVNSASYWGGTPEEYSTLAKAASSAIRAADPSAKVVDPGLSSTTYGYGVASSLLAEGKDAEAIQAWNSYYERRSGTRGEQLAQVSSTAELQEQLDSDQGRRNLTYLALVKQLAESGVVDVRQVHYYESPDTAPMLMSYVKANTPTDVPVEVWEAGLFKVGGGDDVESQAQADEMMRTIGSLLSGGATKVVWLPLAAQVENKKGEEVRGGLLSPTGDIRPQGTIMTALVTASRGADILSVGAEGLSGVSFDRKGTSTLLVWSPAGKSIALPADSAVSEPYTGRTSKPGSQTNLSTSPLLVELPSADASTVAGVK